MSTVLIIPNADFSSMAIGTVEFEGETEIFTSVNPLGSGTVTGAGTYNVGDLVVLEATPISENYEFANWNDGNTDNPRTIGVGIIPMTYTANFNYIEYENNSFTWGKGGITKAGQSSGSTNNTMSTIGNSSGAYILAEHTTTLKAANGYKISAYILSPTQATTGSIVNQTYYHALGSSPSGWLDKLVIEKGKYYQVAINRVDGTNANTSEGSISLLVHEDND